MENCQNCELEVCHPTQLRRWVLARGSSLWLPSADLQIGQSFGAEVQQYKRSSAQRGRLWSKPTQAGVPAGVPVPQSHGEKSCGTCPRSRRFLQGLIIRTWVALSRLRICRWRACKSFQLCCLHFFTMQILIGHGHCPISLLIRALDPN